MDWIKYGKTGVWVSIGVILSGVTFWELTKDPYIDAQAVAEVSAAYRERAIITALRRDDLPQWGEDPEGYEYYEAGRTIGPYISTREIYEKILVPARRMFVNGAPGWYHDAIEPLWCLDTTEFHHGQVLVTMPYEYGSLMNYNEEWGSIKWERSLQLITNTPAVDHVYTTATRWPWEKMNLEPGPYSLHDRFSLRDYFLTNAPFARIFGEFDVPSVPSPEIQEKDGGPWYEVGLGTNAYRLDCEVGSLATNLTVLPYASSNNILQAAAMLEPLKRTIHVVDLGSCQCTQAIRYVGSGFTWERTDEHSDEDTSLAGIRDIANPATLIDRALGEATVTNRVFEPRGTNTIIYYSVLDGWWSARSVSGGGRAEGSGGTTVRPYASDDFFEADSGNMLLEHADVGWTDFWLPVIRPPVPSAYACASGFVSRVQVFGVFVAYANPFFLTVQPVVPPWTLESSSCTDGPHSPPGPGYDYISSHRPHPPSILTADRAESSYRFQHAVSGGVTLSLLVDEAHPQTPPEFSLGVQGGTPPSAGEAMSHTLVKKADPPGEGNNQEWYDKYTGRPVDSNDPNAVPLYSEENSNLYGYEEYTWAESATASLDFGGITRIELITFIIVIDWNWEHLNKERPFVPEEHTPEWMK